MSDTKKPFSVFRYSHACDGWMHMVNAATQAEAQDVVLADGVSQSARWTRYIVQHDGKTVEDIIAQWKSGKDTGKVLFLGIH